MKIRASIATLMTAALLIVGAPAYADEPTPPPSCEETVQDYRLYANEMASALAIIRVETATLRSNLEFERHNAAQGWSAAERAGAENARLRLQLARVQSKMYDLRSKVRYLRTH